MSTDDQYYIFGTGGSGREVLWMLMTKLGLTPARLADRVAFVVSDAHYGAAQDDVMGVPVIAQSTMAADRLVLVALGNSRVRARVVEDLPPATRYGSLVHPTAQVSPWAQVGEGAIITPGCVVTCNVKIGKHVQLNFSTTITHDCQIGDFFTTAPGANVSGNCTIGDRVYLGSNAAIKQGLTICDDTVIGLGAAVVKSIATPGVYAGVPARLRPS